MPDHPNSDNAFTGTSLKGGSHEAAYAGALSFMRRLYSRDLTGVDAVVWGIPFDTATSNRPGTRFGPQGVRRASAILCGDPQYPFGMDIFADMAVIDYGDCTFDYGNLANAPSEMVQQASAIINAESAPYLLTIGGDHFITYPMLMSHVEKHGPLALVQFDAHQDTWDDGGNDGGDNNGARIDHGTMITQAVRDGLIDVEHSIQIGIRTIADEDYGIEILHALEVEEMSANAIATRILERTHGKKTYLTFDIDCLDPAFAPGTGTPVSGGLSSAKALNILNRLDDLDIIGSDVVEVSPAYDHADITSIAGATIAMYMLGLLARRRS